MFPPSPSLTISRKRGFPLFSSSSVESRNSSFVEEGNFQITYSEHANAHDTTTIENAILSGRIGKLTNHGSENVPNAKVQ